VLKVELHTHTSDDPSDWIPHSAQALIDRAAALGYDALAITLHDHQSEDRALAAYAADRGIVLIPGMERTIEGRHVLLLNFPAAAVEAVHSFADVAALKQRFRGLVVAPHPFFPMPCCLLGKMKRHAGIFDAVEYNAMYTSSLNFNRLAERWARRHGKPMVGNGDVHRLEQLGTTYSLVDADRTAASICAAVAAGRVRVVTRPLSWRTSIRIMLSLFAAVGRVPANFSSASFKTNS
jgi:predicted metal-dependent phosphoesterase TrpH